MRRKYTPRAQVHPEVMSAGAVMGAVLKLVEQVAPTTAGPVQLLLTRVFNDDDVTHAHMVWAVRAWLLNNRPLYHLDEALAETLARTEVPSDRFDLGTWLPTDGMYLSLPPIFDVESDDGTFRRVEGLYLVRDRIAVPWDPARDRDEMDTPRQAGDALVVDMSAADAGPSGVVTLESGSWVEKEAITCVGIGRPTRLVAGIPEMRDDAIVTFNLVPGVSLMRGAASKIGGIAELQRVAYNLLYALQRTRSVRSEWAVPEVSRKAMKRSEKKRAALLEGRSTAPYTVLYLSSRVRTVAQPDPAGGEPHAPLAARRLRGPKFISGHFHKYWVRNPDGEHVLEVKDGVSGKLHLVEYLLAPYTQGTDIQDKRQKNVIIRP